MWSRGQRSRLAEGACVGISEVTDCGIGPHRQGSKTRRSLTDGLIGRNRGAEALSEVEQLV